MVKVASAPEAAGAALVLAGGIVLPLLPSAANLLKRRDWPARRRGTLGAARPRAAGRRDARGVNILALDVVGRVKKDIGL